MSEYLILDTGGKKFKLNKQKCLDLEIYLNKTNHGKTWVKLGDKLYYFSNPRNDDDRVNSFLICNEQYKFIQNFLNNHQ